MVAGQGGQQGRPSHRQQALLWIGTGTVGKGSRPPFSRRRREDSVTVVAIAGLFHCNPKRYCSEIGV
jgi:hypothetical protein